MCVNQGVGERPHPEPAALHNHRLAMPLPLFALASALAVQFGGREAWAARPYAKVVIVAVGVVTQEYVAQHVEEVKASVRCMMRAHPRLEERADDVDIEIKRILREDDTEASVSTSVTMSMVAVAQMYP